MIANTSFHWEHRREFLEFQQIASRPLFERVFGVSGPRLWCEYLEHGGNVWRLELNQQNYLDLAAYLNPPTTAVARRRRWLLEHK